MMIEVTPGFKVRRNILEAFIEHSIEAPNRVDEEFDDEADEEYGGGPEPWVTEDD